MSDQALLQSQHKKELRDPKTKSKLCTKMCLIGSILVGIMCLLFKSEVSRILLMTAENLRPRTCPNQILTEGNLHL